MLPSGRVVRPQGMSVSVATWVTPQTGVVQAGPLVSFTVLLRAEVFPAPSRATTAYAKVVLAGSPVSMKDVLSPTMDAALVPPR